MVEVVVDMFVHVVVDGGREVLAGFVHCFVVVAVGAGVGVLLDDVLKGLAQALWLDVFVNRRFGFREIDRHFYGRMMSTGSRAATALTTPFCRASMLLTLSPST